MVGPHHSISPPPPLCGPGCPSRAACQRPRQGALSGPAPTGQFRVCRKLWVCRKPALRQLLRLGCLENFVARPRVQRRLARLHVPDRAVVVRVPSPSPSTGERRRPRHAAHPSSSAPAPRPPPATGHWPVALGACHRPSGLAGRRPPPHRRRGWEDRRRAPRPPARAKGDATTLPPSGLPLGPGRHAWSSHCPLARYAWPAAAVNLPAGRRWPGGFSPH
jgi:hypothetical protein